MKIRKILNKQSINIKFPLNIKEKDKYLFTRELKRKIGVAYCYYFNDILIKSNSYPKIYDLNIIKDFLKFNSLSKFLLIKKLILLIIYLKNTFFFNKPNKNIPKAMIVYDRHSENYFHWLTDVIPKIIWAKKNKELKDYKIIIPKFLNKFQVHTIQALTKNYVIIDDLTTLKVSKLIYISEFHPSGLPRKNFLYATKKFYINKYNEKNSFRKIYISRSNAHRRRLKNEKDLINILKKNNFNIIKPENLSFKNQVNIFRNSSTLISLHGAGLTNLLWMKKRSNIIEIRDSNDFTLNPYFVLSQQMGHKYYYHLSKKNHYSNNIFHPDYELDVDNFYKIFSKVIKF